MKSRGVVEILVHCTCFKLSMCMTALHMNHNQSVSIYTGSRCFVIMGGYGKSHNRNRNTNVCVYCYCNM